MDLNEALNYFEGEGQIATNIANDIRVAYDYIEAEIENPDSDPDQVINGLQVLIDQKKTDSSMFCPERKAVIAVYAALQGLFEYIKTDSNLFNYAYNSSNSQVSTRGGGWDCLFPCLLNGVTIGGIIGLVAGVAVLVASGGTAALITPLMVTGMSVGIVGGLGMLNNESSNCNSCEDDFDCNGVAGVSLAFSNCNPSATYTAFGFGNDVTMLTWTNTGGTPATATTTVAAAAPTILNITQTSPTIPVITTITTNCPPSSDDAETIVLSRNLATIVGQVLGLTLHGEDHAVPGETYYYHVFGIDNNPSYTTEWFINNGTIVNSDDGYAEVIWGVGSSWIQAQVTNNCPGGQSRTYTFNVEGDGDEIP